MKFLNLFVFYIFINQCFCINRFSYRILNCIGNTQDITFLDNKYYDEITKIYSDLSQFLPFVKTFGNFGYINSTIGKYYFNPKQCFCEINRGKCLVSFKNFINDHTEIESDSEDSLYNKYDINLLVNFEILILKNKKNGFNENELEYTEYLGINNNEYYKLLSSNETSYEFAVGITDELRNRDNSCKNLNIDYSRDRFFFGNVYRDEDEKEFQKEIGFSSPEDMVNKDITFPIYFESLPKNCKEKLLVGKFVINSVKECLNTKNKTKSAEIFYNREGYDEEHNYDCDFFENIIVNGSFILKFNKKNFFIGFIVTFILILY